jgi:NAD(P)-dependent dehydrogenase (short-subunit alcohol dehydrogenase family)
MDYGCKGKVVCITGGTSGIGLAAAEAFALDGAIVLLVGRNRAKGESVIRDLHSLDKHIRAAFPACGCEQARRMPKVGTGSGCLVPYEKDRYFGNQCGNLSGKTFSQM